MGKTISHQLQLVNQPFGNLRFRDRTALILCRDENGKLLLGREDGFYPPGIFRMIGGGIDDGEAVIDGTIREIKEELRLAVVSDDLVELAEVTLEGTFQEKVYTTKIFVYFLKVMLAECVANDDVSELISCTEAEYAELVERFFELQDDHIYKKDDFEFSWGDYGRAYGFIHQLALDEVIKRGL
jgi:8-oxo-dGTP pyrophosphatase MutT (NUDIX family)